MDTRWMSDKQRESLSYLEMYPNRVTSQELAMALEISPEAAGWRLLRMYRRGWLSRRRIDLRGSTCEWEYDLEVEAA